MDRQMDTEIATKRGNTSKYRGDAGGESGGRTDENSHESWNNQRQITSAYLTHCIFYDMWGH